MHEQYSVRDHNHNKNECMMTFHLLLLFINAIYFSMIKRLIRFLIDPGNEMDMNTYTLLSPWTLRFQNVALETDFSKTLKSHSIIMFRTSILIEMLIGAAIAINTFYYTGYSG